MFRKSGSWGLLALLAGLLVVAPVRAEWSTTQIRGAVDIVELVTPLFGQPGEVHAGVALNFGLGWRQLDESDDGMKPWGLYVGASWDIADPFNFNWVQLTGGATYEEVLQVGTGVWLGNKIETAVDDSTGEEQTWVVPGLAVKNKFVLGFGVQGETID